MSKPDSGIRGLRPDLYQSDRAFLIVESQHEVRGILAETEPQPFDYQLDGRWTSHVWDFYPHGHGMSETRAALAESLASFIDQEMS